MQSKQRMEERARAITWPVTRRVLLHLATARVTCLSRAVLLSACTVSSPATYVLRVEGGWIASPMPSV